jgi:DNA-binding NtrC family response regulator
MDVIIIDEQPHRRLSLFERLRNSDITALAVGDVTRARASCHENGGAVSVIIVGGCGAHGPVMVSQVKNEWPTLDVFATGDASDVRAAVDAVRYGAVDYFAFPTDSTALVSAVRNALERARRRPASPANGGADNELEEAITFDPATRAVFERAERAAAVDSTVLITGESGTGKEVLARHMYRRSPRRRRRFVPVNCGAVPETLIETELFGYKKGAFTGAVANGKGLIDEAEGGVLFLDEIGDMPPPMQVRLLRFLDRGEVRAVGATEVKRADVRVIAATNRCLAADIRDRRFREDLFFRLSVVSLHLPPLRERRGEILPLLSYYVRRAARRFGVDEPTIAPEAIDILHSYHWPGNIRELQNALEQAVVQQSSGAITPRDLPDRLFEPAVSAPAPRERRTPVERTDEIVVSLLRQYNGNHTETAAALGISRSTLWRRLRRINATLPEPSLPAPDSVIA